MVINCMLSKNARMMCVQTTCGAWCTVFGTPDVHMNDPGIMHFSKGLILLLAM